MYMKDKIVSLDVLKKAISEQKKYNKRIVATSGCFDIIHAGHVEYLEAAKQYGDVMVVFLNSDRSVRELKGYNRPIVTENERAEVVAALGCIDYVCIFDESDPCRVIAEVTPDIWVKGADYEGKVIPEHGVIDSYGGKIVYADFKCGCTSTSIIEKIKKCMR